MRILNFNLTAFGPFTNTRLDFDINDSNNAGLYLVYGPNEAGKSSALRGLTALLYGFEHQTTDNFIHFNNELQVSGTLVHSNGNRLEIHRRKGIKNTLSNLSGQPLNETILKNFLNSIDKHFFQTVFGIDHLRLREGGKEILEGGGRIGEALFAAATGFTGLRQFATDLNQEAETLFKFRGKNQKIVSLKRQYDEIRRDRDAQVLRGADWQNHDTELRQAIIQLTDLQQQLTQLHIEKTRLERIHQALPHIARRQELLQHINDFKEVVLLPDDFIQRRIQTQQMLANAERELATSTSELERIDRELQGLSLNSNLLDLGTTIEHLSQQSGQFDKYNQELPKLNIQIYEQEMTALNLLQDLRPDLTLAQAASELRVPKAQRDGIRELGNRYGAIENRRNQANITQLSVAAELVKQRQDLECLGQVAELSALKHSVERAQLAGNLDDSLTALNSKLTKEQAQTEIGLRKLGWNQSLEQLEQLALPPLETIDLFHNDFVELLHRQNTLMEQLNKAQTNFSECTRQLTALNLESAVPTEAALQQARSKRDLGWQLVRQAWLNGQRDATTEAAYVAQQNLPDAYEYNVKIADELADRLRREAARVQQQARAQADYVHYQKEIGQLQRMLADFQQQKTQREQAWQEVWQVLGVVSRSPKEMRVWWQNAEKLRMQASTLRNGRLEAADLQSRYAELLAELGVRLQELGEHFDSNENLLTRLNRARILLQKHERLAQERRRFEISIGDAERRHREVERALLTAEQELHVWHEQWAAAVKILGLNANATPVQANSALEQIEGLFKALQDVAIKREQVKHIETWIAVYASKVTEMCAHLAPDLIAQTPLSAMTLLNVRLQEARNIATKQAMLIQQAQTHCNQLEIIRSQHNNAQLRLNACLQEARCNNVTDLPELELKSTQRREIEREYAICRNRLLELSGGKGEATLLEEVALLDVDILPSRIENIRNEIKDLEAQRAILHQTIGAKREVLKGFDGSSSAADKTMELENISAQLRNAGERYLQLRLANILLEQQIEEYRQRQQTPLLSRASAIFARITGGAFGGLESVFLDTNQQVLRGLRTEGKPVSTESMSDGTRDQLFLALRLASIQIYLERSEAMPLIVDDILVHYDDMRSAATLQVLAELAQHTQVIMFTHHQHLLELANKFIKNEQFVSKSLLA